MSLARSEAPVRGLGRAVVDARWILFFGLVVFAGRIEESGLGGDGLR